MRSNPVSERRHQRGTDNDTVGVAADLGGLLSRPHPSPTPTGISDISLTLPTNSGAALDTTSRAPVTPIVDAA